MQTARDAKGQVVKPEEFSNLDEAMEESGELENDEALNQESE